MSVLLQRRLARGLPVARSAYEHKTCSALKNKQKQKAALLSFSTLAGNSSMYSEINKKQKQFTSSHLRWKVHSQATRSYLYIPTSWKELQLRMEQANAKKRTVRLKLSERLADFWKRTKSTTQSQRDRWKTNLDTYQTKYQTYQLDYRNKFQTKQLEWKKKRQLRNLRRQKNTARTKALWRSASTAAAKKLLFIELQEYSQADWFHKETGKPLTSRDPTGRFVNPWCSSSADGVHSVATLLQWRVERLYKAVENVIQNNPLGHIGTDLIGGRTSVLDGTIASAALSTSKADGTSSAVASTSLTNPQQNHELFPALDGATASDLTSPLTAVSRTRSITTTTAAATTSKTSIPVPLATSASSCRVSRLTWIGHATCLLQHPYQDTEINILTDPIFSRRSSPWQNSPIGVVRDVAPALQIEELPETIDLCIVSHDHYDHLDKDSVVQLKERVGLWVVPTGVEEWLQEKCDISNTVALNWWESLELKPEHGQLHQVSRCCLEDAPHLHPYHANICANNVNTEREAAHESIWVTCCPVQHWGSRTMWDRNYRLWASFACFLPSNINSNPFLFYFGGDTARPENFPLFEQIRDYLGQPVDVAALPIGAYEPVTISRDAHMNPREAVLVHHALEAKQSVGIHWGTFALGDEPLNEPAEWLAQVAPSNFVTINHGASLEVPLEKEYAAAPVLEESADTPVAEEKSRSYAGSSSRSNDTDIDPVQKEDDDDDSIAAAC